MMEQIEVAVEMGVAPVRQFTCLILEHSGLCAFCDLHGFYQGRDADPVYVVNRALPDGVSRIVIGTVFPEIFGIERATRRTIQRPPQCQPLFCTEVFSDVRLFLTSLLFVYIAYTHCIYVGVILLLFSRAYCLCLQCQLLLSLACVRFTLLSLPNKLIRAPDGHFYHVAGGIRPCLGVVTTRRRTTQLLWALQYTYNSITVYKIKIIVILT